MDTEKYKMFLTVIEKGSLSAAAEILGYTPSGVSRSIAAIESELDVKLLYRSKKGIQPTGACMSLLPAIRDLVKNADRVIQISAAVTGILSGHLVIGTAYSCYYKWIAEMTSQFHELHPGIDFKIIYGTSTELSSKITTHNADFCIISKRNQEGSEWIPLMTDELMALLPPDHSFAGADRMPVGIFAEESYIDTYPGQDIDNARVFNRCGINPNTRFSTMDIYATYSMVEAGLGISMNNNINSRFLNYNVCHTPLYPAQTVEIGLAMASDPAPAAAAFLDYISEKMPSII